MHHDDFNPEDPPAGPPDGNREPAGPARRSDLPEGTADASPAGPAPAFPDRSTPEWDSLPNELRLEIQQNLFHQQVVQSFPDPLTARELKEHAPEVYEAWIETTKQTIATDNHIRRAYVDNPRRIAMRGQLLGLIAVLGVLALAGFAAWLDHPWLAGVLVAIDVVALAAVFNSGSSPRRQDTDSQ
ncbi:MAG: phage holin family protein [Corynebacterium sp.]|uniref:phage holin family protein n=1 Tax=Corynebacterium sp. TaxID=1720 RepID=UPI0026DEB5EB|nr:phage holin family protein [Corynebacterium sp.]MDO5670842.1 phage holin family protein [Corynebacterium sp.]